jgi:DNA-binding MarR family transcriptional regulator
MDGLLGPGDCNCLAVRQAARHITQFYDQLLAPSGLRTTQFSILAKLRQLRPMPINALAQQMVMDRTTLGRNILPLARHGLIAVEPGKRDKRSKTLRLTEAGAARFRAATKAWVQHRGDARPAARRRGDRPRRRRGCRRRVSYAAARSPARRASQAFACA